MSSKREATPEGEATTTSDFFGGKNKPKRSAPVKTKAVAEKKSAETATPKKPSKQTPSTPASDKVSKTSENGPASATRTSARSKPTVKYEDDFGDDDFAEDIFAADFQKTGQTKKDDYDEGSENEVALPHRESPMKNKHKKATPKATPQKKTKVEDEDVDMEDDEDLPVKSRTNGKKSTASTRKRKTPELSDEDDLEEDEPPKKATKKAPAKKKAKQEEVKDSADIQAIYESVTIRPPTPPPQSGEAKKFDFRAQHANTGPPPAQGAKEIPTGKENCLAGLTFVFTGLLPTIERNQGQALVKRYGGKVTGAPSKKTSFVVLGSDAGPKKLQTIRDNNIKTIDEDGLLKLIATLPANGGDSKAAAAYEEKQQKEAEKIKEMAAELEKEERRLGGAGGAGGGKALSQSSSKNGEPTKDSRLWTVKYAPSSTNQICGNKTQVEKLQRWLRAYPKNQRTGFKLAGGDGSGVFRAVMIHGPPGIGKTTAAHLVAKLEGYDVVESNASDTRSKRLVEEGLKGVLSTTSLHGYFAGDGKKVEESKKKLVLIMDEVDGMSAGDRGGVGALAAMCKKTQIPMILICNERRLPKMKPFDYAVYDLPFRRPTVDNIRSRVMTIAYREGLRLPPNVVDALIEGSNADIRQIVNMISTIKLDQKTMDFDSGKEMSKAWEKHVILKPWDIVGKILGGGMFAESSKATLNDKSELYFNDHEMSHLMLQENYLGTNPIAASKYSGKEKNLKWLELVDRAAESMSDGDMVDRMIHGSQQQWSLMPTHSIFSFVRPASFVAGSMAGHGGTRFPAWLGKNSTQSKLTRLVKEIQGHMRLRSSGDRHEVRQQYVPILWQRLVKRLERDGRDAIPDVIELMDSYFLTKEDFDAIQELGVGDMEQEKVKIESATKSAFTRT